MTLLQLFGPVCALFLCLQNTDAVPTFTRPTLVIANYDGLTYIPGQTTSDASVVIETENTGNPWVDYLPAAGGDDVNFNLHWFISTNDTLETSSDLVIGVEGFAPRPQSGNLSSGVPGGSRLRIEATVSLAVPSMDTCSQNAYMCARLALSSRALLVGAKYEETDGDYTCIPFGSGDNTTAGELVCPAVIDTPVLSVTFTNGDVYLPGIETVLSVSLTIKNIDSEHELRSATAPALNFEDTWWFSKDGVVDGVDDDRDDSAVLEPTGDETLASGIPAPGEVNVVGLVTVVMPTVGCEEYQFFCVKLSLNQGVAAVYGTGRTDYACLRFDEENGGAGEKMCSAVTSRLEPSTTGDDQQRSSGALATKDVVLLCICILVSSAITAHEW